MSQAIQVRRGTADQWAAANTLLAEGEIGLELDTSLYKIGDGSTTWNSLPYGTMSPTANTVTLVSQTSDPSSAPEGYLHLYSKSFAGRIMPKWKGPSGLDTVVQPALFGNGITAYAPGVSTVPNVIGGPTLTNVGTVSHPALASNTLLDSISRWRITSAATANAASESRLAILRCYRGDTDGRGGFFFSARFGIASAVATQQGFIGLTSYTTATPTTQVPSALTDALGVGWDNGDGVLKIMHNDSSGTCTKIDLGANFPVTTLGTVYEIQLFSPPNGSTVGYRLKRLDVDHEENGTITTNIPSSTTWLTAHAYMNNGGTASAVMLDMMRIYIETDN